MELLAFHFLAKIFAVRDFFYFSSVLVKGIDKVQIGILEVVFVTEVDVDWFVNCFDVW